MTAQTFLMKVMALPITLLESQTQIFQETLNGLFPKVVFLLLEIIEIIQATAEHGDLFLEKVFGAEQIMSG